MNLSLKYWIKHMKTAASIIAAVMFGTAAVTCATFLARTNAQTDIEKSYDEYGDYDIVVPEADKEQIDIIRGNIGIEKVGVIYNGGLCKTQNGVTKPFGAFEDKTAEDLFHYNISDDGRYPQKSGEIAGYKTTFEEMGVAAVVGNTVTLETYTSDEDEEGTVTANFTIVGVMNDQRGKGVMRGLDLSDYEFPQLFVYKDEAVSGEFTRTAIALCGDESNSYDVIKELRKDKITAYASNRLIGVFLPATQIYADTQNGIYSVASSAPKELTSRVIIPIFTAIILIVSFLSIYDIISTAFIERQKNLSLLRCVGMPLKRTVIMLLAETTIMVLSGIIVGYFTGVSLYIGIVEFANNILELDLFYGFSVHPIVKGITLNPYIYPIVVSLIGSFTATMLPLLKNMRKSPLEVLSVKKSKPDLLPVKNKRGLLRKSFGGNILNNISSFIIILAIVWSPVFGSVFFLAKSEASNSYMKSQLEDVQTYNSDYYAYRDLYKSTVADLQFNRHGDGVSPDSLNSLKNSKDADNVMDIIKIPGMKAIYKYSEENDGLLNSLSPLNIINSMEKMDFLSELQEKTLETWGYSEDDMIFSLPFIAVDNDLLCELCNESDIEKINNGSEVVVIEFDGIDSINPYKKGDKIVLSDIVIKDDIAENHDFSENTMPDGSEPTFYYDYSDGSGTNLPGYAFGENVQFEVEVADVIKTSDEKLTEILHTSSYVLNDEGNGYADPGFCVIGSTAALSLWNLPDRNYTDVFVNISGNADTDRFETLWYTVIGKSTGTLSVSRNAVEESLKNPKLRPC